MAGKSATGKGGMAASEDGMRAGRLTTVFRRALESVAHGVGRVSASGGRMGTLLNLFSLLLLAGWTLEAGAQAEVLVSNNAKTASGAR